MNEGRGFGNCSVYCVNKMPRLFIQSMLRPIGNGSRVKLLFLCTNTALNEFNENQTMRPARHSWLAFWFLFLFSLSPTAESAEPTHRDIEYAKAGATSLKLDLYLPPERAGRPVIVWVHGGAWRSGSKSDVPITAMLTAGFAIASVDYRLSPEAPFPAQIHDIKAAIRFLRANCDRFQLDSNRFVIAGSSAGGHLAALAGVSDRAAELDGTLGEHLQVSSRVQSIVSFFGASNLQTILAQSTPFGLNVRVPALDLFLGGQPDAKPELARLASPVAHVDRNDPPLWLYHGDQDPQMPINQAHELHGAYQRARLPVSFEVLHNSKHGGPEFFQEERLNKLSDELLRTLTPRSGAIVGDASANAGGRVLRDLEYVPNGHERQRLDLYLPENAKKPIPVIVWVHGGGWSGGSKANSPAVRFVPRGFAVASINYRLSQHAIFPAQIHDCKAAVRWLRAHADEYNLDRTRFAAWGSSAGGQLVALMGTTNGVKELEGNLGVLDQSSDIQAVVDWFGPTDFLTVGPKETRTKLLGGDAQQNKEQARKASPMSYVSKNSVPHLIMHGDQDNTVPIAQSETFANALKAVGVDITFVKIEGAAHGGPLFNGDAGMKHVEDFLGKHLLSK